VIFYVGLYHIGRRSSVGSNAGIFFAGVGTTFIILEAGFGGRSCWPTRPWTNRLNFKPALQNRNLQFELCSPPPQGQRNRRSNRSRNPAAWRKTGLKDGH
jgi:hypothetical protein